MTRVVLPSVNSSLGKLIPFMSVENMEKCLSSLKCITKVIQNKAYINWEYHVDWTMDIVAWKLYCLDIETLHSETINLDRKISLHVKSIDLLPQQQGGLNTRERAITQMKNARNIVTEKMTDACLKAAALIQLRFGWSPKKNDQYYSDIMKAVRVLYENTTNIDTSFTMIGEILLHVDRTFHSEWKSIISKSQKVHAEETTENLKHLATFVCQHLERAREMGVNAVAWIIYLELFFEKGLVQK